LLKCSFLRKEQKMETQNKTQRKKQNYYKELLEELYLLHNNVRHIQSNVQENGTEDLETIFIGLTMIDSSLHLMIQNLQEKILKQC
jgi:hypothetical protein